MPPEFVKDRIEYSGGGINIEKMKSALPFSLQQFAAMIDWAEQGLIDGRDYFLGSDASLVDFDFYFNLWFAARAPAAKKIIEDCPLLSKWMARMAAFGHGKPTELTSKDALEIARKDDVATYKGVIGENEGRHAGDMITVTPNDTGRVPVSGELVALNHQEIALRHENDIVGEVIIHFPRAGFIVS